MTHLINVEKTFSDIYKHKKWHQGSGSGSQPETTILYREFVHKFLGKNKIKRVIDLGCGDWAFSRLINWSELDYYIGIDIVDSVIEKNNLLFANSTIKFMCLNIIESEWPDADLLILKDVLQHLSNKNIEIVLEKAKKYKYLLITNEWVKDCKNNDIQDGDVRPLDLRLAPFKQDFKILYKFKSPSLRTSKIYNKCVFGK